MSKCFHNVPFNILLALTSWYILSLAHRKRSHSLSLALFLAFYSSLLLLLRGLIGWLKDISSPEHCQNYVLLSTVIQRRRRFWHAIHDCVAPDVDIILHRGRFLPKSAASGSVSWCCFRSCWTVLSHVMRGRPSCLLQSAGGEG